MMAFPREPLSVPVVRKPHDTEQLRKARATFRDTTASTAG